VHTAEQSQLNLTTTNPLPLATGLMAISLNISWLVQWHCLSHPAPHLIQMLFRLLYSITMREAIRLSPEVVRVVAVYRFQSG
jgi:hypothetical protein